MIKVRLAGTDGTALRAGRIRNYDQNIDGADEPDRIPVTDDPDDRSTTVMQQSNDLLSPPEMPAAWWIRVVLGSDSDLITPEDALTVFLHIRHRLAGPDATTGAFPPPGNAMLACLVPSEGGDSGQGTSSATAPLNRVVPENHPFKEVDPISTIGQLHERIEELFGSPGWTAFTALWQKACNIEPPPKREKREGREDHGVPKPDTPLLPLPANTPLLEEGLHRELERMPVKVQAFFLHSPKEPAPWVYRESLDERSQREQLEAEGAWTG